MRYQTVLFDLDGTLIDTSPGILASYRGAAEKFGAPVPEREDLRRLMGPSMAENAERFFGLSGAAKAGFLEEVVAIRRRLGPEGGVLYPGMMQLLERLRAAGLRAAVCTMKTPVHAADTLRLFGLDGFFDRVEGFAPDSCATKADIIRRCLAKLGADAPSAVLVGDTNVDGAGAADAGIDFIAAGYGYGFSSGLPNASRTVFTAMSPGELGEYLLRR